MSEKFKAYTLSFMIHLIPALLILSLSYNLERAKSSKIIEIDLSITQFEVSREEIRERESEKNVPQEPERTTQKVKPIDMPSKRKPENQTTELPKTEAVLENKQEQRIQTPELTKVENSSEKTLQDKSPSLAQTGGSSGYASNQQVVNFKGAKDGAGEDNPVAYRSSEESYIRENLSVITKIVQRYINYPPIARRMGWEGKVLVGFILNPAGEIRDLRILKSCGYEILDREALEGVKKSYRDFPRPSVEVLVKLPIAFKLE